MLRKQNEGIKRKKVNFNPPTFEKQTYLSTFSVRAMNWRSLFGDGDSR